MDSKNKDQKINYFSKYLKYKNKYINLKTGGAPLTRKSSIEDLNDSSSKLVRSSSSPILERELSYIDIASLDSNDIVIEDLKLEDVIEFIRLCFLDVDKCEFLFNENVIGIIESIEDEIQKILLREYFDKGFEIFIKIFLEQINTGSEEEIALKSQIQGLVIEFNPERGDFEDIYNNFMKNVNDIYNNTYGEFYTIVTKDPDSEYFRDSYGDYLEEYIRVVKYKGLIMGYYRYSLNYNRPIDELIEDSFGNEEKKEFFEYIKNKYSEVPFNIIFVNNRCSFSNFDKLYPRKNINETIKEIYQPYIENNGPSIGALLWNDIKLVVSSNNFLNAQPTFIINIIENEIAKSYHFKHGSFELKETSRLSPEIEVRNDATTSLMAGFSGLADDSSLYIIETFRKDQIELNHENILDFKNYIFNLILNLGGLHINLIGMFEKSERTRNLRSESPFKPANIDL